MMNVFYKKIFFFIASIFAVIISVNYFIDPANIYHHGMVKKMVQELENGHIIVNPGNIDEGRFQESRIRALRKSPETVIIGSSHVMYEKWNFGSEYVAALSGAYIGDFYSIVGLLEKNNHIPKAVLIGIDPWTFMRDVKDVRHTSIKKYGTFIFNKINSVNDEAEDSEIETNKISELFSVAYFQESFNVVKKMGLKSFGEERNKVVISENDNMEKFSKIMPNGRRVFSVRDLKTITENDAYVNKLIKSGSIYQLERGFREVQVNNIKDFEALIEYLSRKDVKVEFYLHPWYPMAYEHFVKNPAFAGVIKTEDYLRNYAKSKRIIVRGSFSPKLCSVNDSDFADWLHLKAEKMMECYNIIL